MRSRLFILVLFCSSLSVYAEKRDSIKLEGKVFDQFNRVEIPNTLVEVLSGSDSAYVNSGKAYRRLISGDKEEQTSDYSVMIPKVEGKYILRFSRDGYDPAYMDIHIGKLGKRVYKLDMRPAYLKPSKSISLEEVVVKATKVKFYHKGDTLVYNADAFQMPDGSMLDALIRQLPGAELKKNGQIYVNGKYVENLLLNGKDFFKGDNSVMLENLPNYMVSSVNVYERLGDNSRFLGHEVDGDRQYVMDVKLKKKYSIGWVGNMEAGYGTKNRDLLRLFALRFSDHSRVSIYGNINNLNDARKPGENDNWKPSDLVGGLTKQQVGGIDYSIDGKGGKYKLNGNAQIRHQDTDEDKTTNRKNFLAGGDTYERMANANRNHDLSISTDHRFYFEGRMANLELKPRLDYRKYDNRNSLSSLTLSEDISGFGKARMDSLFSRKLGKDFLSSAINRNLQEGIDKGHSLKAFLSANSIIKFNNSSDYLTLYVDAAYANSSEESFDHNRIEYYSQGKIASVDYQNRYFDNIPDRNYHLTGKATYTYNINKGCFLNLTYQYERDYKRRNSFLYRLDQLSDWDEEESCPLGSLPSVEAYGQVMDASNSYDSKLYSNRHTLEPFLVWSKNTKGGSFSAQVALPVSFLSRTLRYQRGDMDTTMRKHTTLINTRSTYIRWKSSDRKYDVSLFYNLQAKAPDMDMYLNIHDTTDPLNVMMGNPDLKNAYTHELRMSFGRMFPQQRIMCGVEGSLKMVANEIAMGYTYDQSSGRRTFRPDNVSGNRSGVFSAFLAAPINKKKNMTLKGMLGLNYRRCVDLIGVEGTSAYRSIVRTLGLQEMIGVDWRIKAITIGFKSEGTWGRTTGTRQDFQSFNSSDMSNGLTAQAQLPWNFQLGTDVTLYSRWGYVDEEMNTNDFVWNVRLSRPFLKGKVLLMVDGFDILGQLSNVTHTINAQAITEVYTNVIPRYLMFHVVYRFRKAPKK